MKAKILVCLILISLGNYSSLMAQEDEWFQKGLNATNPNEKIEYFTKSIQQNPRWQPFAARGNVKFDLTDYQGALEDFQEALKYFGTVDSQVKFQLTNYGSLNDQNQGILDDLLKNDLLKGDLEEWLKKVCTRDLFYIYCNLGVTNRYLQNFLDALKYFTQALEIMPEETALHWGEFEYSNKYYELSMLEYNESNKLDSTYINTYFNRGLTYFDLQQYDKASSDFEKTVELNPANADAYFSRGVTYLRLKQYDKAITDFTKVIELNPIDAEAYYNRGFTNYKLGQYDKAISDCIKVIELNPNNPNSYIGLGTIYFNKKDYKNAINISLQGLEQDPANKLLYDNIAYYYMEIGANDDAITNFRKCLAIDSDSFDATLGLSIAYYYKGDMGNAKRYLDGAKTLEPRLKKGMEGITEIDKDGKYSFSDKKKETLAKMLDELK